jgi:UDP-N-acetyl-D-galactosamine dehydrogenase
MKTVAIVGLGYVGLPLAIEFGKQFRTIGFDLSAKKVDSYHRHIDPAGEISAAEFRSAGKLEITTNPVAIRDAGFIIIAIPTPVDNAQKPDFSPLISASQIVGQHMRAGAIVIFESTVYPGATEEVCIPVLEKFSGLKWKQDFHVGYSPERINPGDREHGLCNVVKVVAGDDAATLEAVANLYLHVVKAGVHRASSIRVAEAAKVIENTQRDLNIALMNELAIIFDKTGIDTLEVLEAAGTKWNFLPFRPGLVGGHCIGVDPYYLTHKAEMLGYHPEVILAGRRINDGMGKYVAEQTIKQMVHAGSPLKGAKVNILGLTFKENCADLRNTRVIDVIHELQSYGIEVHVHDPQTDAEEARQIYNIELKSWNNLPQADAIVLAVAHREFAETPFARFREKVIPGGCIIDVKSQLDPLMVKNAGLTLWRL